MTRFRSRSAGSKEEAAFQDALGEAQSALRRAQALCGSMRRVKGAGSQEGRKALASSRKIGQALNVLRDIGSIGPSFDTSDPDMMSENARLQLARKAREEKRQLRRQSSRGKVASTHATE